MADSLSGLAEAIEALRAELTTAMMVGAGQSMRFSLDPIELTLQVVVTKDVNGKIGWKILEFGGHREAVSTQTLTLKLTPLWPRTDGTLTKDFTIASTGPADQHFGPARTADGS